MFYERSRSSQQEHIPCAVLRKTSTVLCRSALWNQHTYEQEPFLDRKCDSPHPIWHDNTQAIWMLNREVTYGLLQNKRMIRHRLLTSLGLDLYHWRQIDLQNPLRFSSSFFNGARIVYFHSHPPQTVLVVPAIPLAVDEPCVLLFSGAPSG